jgi:hypothetical protein
MGGELPGRPVPPEEDVPPRLRQAWEEAEARLFPVVMVRPDLYERSLTLVRQTVDELRRDCHDAAALVAQVERADALVADVAARAAISTSELRLGLIASAAFAMRYRELAAERARRAGIARLTQARAEGVGWVLAEESGSEEHAMAVAYWRLEVHVPSGAALLMSVEPDETLTRPVYRLEGGRLDLTTGALDLAAVPDLPASEYRDRADWQTASDQIRKRLVAACS